MSATTITTSAAAAVTDSAASVFSAGHAVIVPAVGIRPAAEWDLLSFLENSQKYGTLFGAGLVTLIGLILIIVAIVFLAKKFLSGQQSQGAGWAKIIVMGMIGGALMAGGIAWVVDVAQGLGGSVNDLGGAVILIDHARFLAG